MAIIAASIEANGWVLRLRVSGAPGDFASYTLDPDGSPRVSLAVSHPGFETAGGIAVAAPCARTIVATKPLRKPVNPATPATPVIDETDNGDGTVTLRLALSGYVHATETSVALAVAAGWRSGEAAAAGVGVVNSSTFAAALPIMRWADVSYQRSAGPLTLELVVLSHHPRDLTPVAGVRFTVTDGTTVKTGWATALTTSTKYGDQLRCYAVIIDAAAAPALNPGLLRCDAEVYPWLGSMRSTDPAGTGSMTGLASAGYATKAETPMIVGYDPAGTRYGARVVFVDPVGGTGTASAAMVQPDLAAAKAGTRARDVTTAVQALYLQNRTLAAANGGAAATRATDAARIVLAAGTHAGFGNVAAVSPGATSAELPVSVEGDPDLADPRAAVVLQTATAQFVRVSKMALRNLTLEVGTVTLSGLGNWHLDNIEVRGKAGQTSNTVPPFSSSPTAGFYNRSAVRTRYWRAGTSFQGGNMRFGLLRACEFSRRSEALAVIGCRMVGQAEDGFSGGGGTGSWNSSTDQGAAEDVIFLGNDLRSAATRSFSFEGVAAATAGTPNTSYRRYALVNNLCESIGNNGQPFWSMGESVSATMSYNLIEGNTFIGERCNMFYGDPTPVTLADTNTQVNQAIGNRVANNSFDWVATKHDTHDDPVGRGIRTAAGVPNPTGYRPQMVDTWSVLYGVGFEGNYDWGRHSSAGNFRFEYFGRRGVQALGGVPAWPADRSTYGSPTTGGGTYKPPAASLLVGRGLAASSDRDRTGAVRTLPFASGAVDTAAAAPVALTPASGVLASLAASALVAWGAALLPAGGTLVTVGPAPAVTVTGLTLLPGSAGMRLSDIGAALLPDLLFTTPRLVRIEGEVTVQLVQRD